MAYIVEDKLETLMSKREVLFKSSHLCAKQYIVLTLEPRGA